MKPRITVCLACPAYGQRRAFRKLKRAIRVSDRRLAALLEMFGHLNYDEDTRLLARDPLKAGHSQRQTRE